MEQAKSSHVDLKLVATVADLIKELHKSLVKYGVKGIKEPWIRNEGTEYEKARLYINGANRQSGYFKALRETLPGGDEFLGFDHFHVPGLSEAKMRNVIRAFVDLNERIRVLEPLHLELGVPIETLRFVVDEDIDIKTANHDHIEASVLQDIYWSEDKIVSHVDPPGFTTYDKFRTQLAKHIKYHVGRILLARGDWPV